MDLEKIRTCYESLEQDIISLRMTERIEFEFYSEMIDAVKTISAEITAQPKSNADRIRQMTDEEIAAIIGSSCMNCIHRDEPECDSFDCYEGKLSYLKQEVSEDAGTD